MAKYPKGFLCAFLATVKHTESARVNKAGLGGGRKETEEDCLTFSQEAEMMAVCKIDGKKPVVGKKSGL